MVVHTAAMVRPVPSGSIGLSSWTRRAPSVRGRAPRLFRHDSTPPPDSYRHPTPRGHRRRRWRRTLAPARAQRTRCSVRARRARPYRSVGPAASEDVGRSTRRGTTRRPTPAAGAAPHLRRPAPSGRDPVRPTSLPAAARRGRARRRRVWRLIGTTPESPSKASVSTTFSAEARHAATRDATSARARSAKRPPRAPLSNRSEKCFESNKASSTAAPIRRSTPCPGIGVRTKARSDSRSVHSP